ncbi:MAG: DUF115 domain-containing protein [Oligoflexales bacterium]|nr:DUF115 domain-containing protein [Oligoflexales bacterium]
MKDSRKLNIFEKADALVIDYLNLKTNIKFRIDSFRGKFRFLEKNRELHNLHKGKRACIVGNAPSINNQKLELLRNDVTFMVNRSFLLDSYEKILPSYHVITDPKLANGTWPIEYLDEIMEKNPGVTFLLNADWFHLSKFDYYKKKANIYWLKTKLISPSMNRKLKIDLTTLSPSYFVAEQALTTAVYMGFESIILTGVEGNGYAYQTLGMNSHAHGNDPDYANATPFDQSRALQFASRWIKVWYSIAGDCEKKGIKLTNCAPGGVLDMIDRQDFNNVFNN